jgi:hypothetical protein
MDEFLRLHQPSEVAQQRAKQASINLAELKQTNPQDYKMLVAQPILEVSVDLEQHASNILTAAFRHHEVFRLEQRDMVILLIFPELSTKELDKLDRALSQLTELPSLKTKYVYYRVVTDKTGEHRQLALPLAPSQWQGQHNVLLGPFDHQADAEAWGEQNARPSNLIHDTVNYAGAWFCDVFSGE